MVIASQTCETKGWVDDNGMDQCRRNLGGLTAERANPIDGTKWFDKHNDSDTLGNSESARLLVSWGGGGLGSMRQTGAFT